MMEGSPEALDQGWGRGKKRTFYGSFYFYMKKILLAF